MVVHRKRASHGSAHGSTHESALYHVERNARTATTTAPQTAAAPHKTAVARNPQHRTESTTVLFNAMKRALRRRDPGSGSAVQASSGWVGAQVHWSRPADARFSLERGKVLGVLFADRRERVFEVLACSHVGLDGWISNSQRRCGSDFQRRIG